MAQHRPLVGRGRDLRDWYSQRSRNRDEACGASMRPDVPNDVPNADSRTETTLRKEDIVRSALRDRQASKLPAAVVMVSTQEGKGTQEVASAAAERVGRKRTQLSRRPSLPARLAMVVSTNRCREASETGEPDEVEASPCPPPARSLWARRHSQPVRALDEIKRQKQGEAQQEELLLRRAQRQR
eukprot:GGOE01000819.1.p1 GENE.GGOE01000819.1~~GGOE01000819.1.p1  ORF type:complete len:214 (-),score=35.12 GGOE01000819.1:324-875(-)